MKRERVRWDARYAAGERRHDVGALPLLAAWVSRLSPGRALDLAAGLGRHTLFLARRGWVVDAVDISFEGLRILSRRARAAKLRVNPSKRVDQRRLGSRAAGINGSINLVVADLDRFECRPGAYDLIVQTFFMKRRLLPRLWRWVRPGGLVYLETHLRGPRAPSRSRYALRRGELGGLFRRWEILRYDEGMHPEGDRRLATARLLARRPASLRRIASTTRVGQ